MFSIAFGRAASLLAVANANDTGSVTALIKRLIGILAINAIGNNTQVINTINETYKVPTNLNRFIKISIPDFATVLAKAPKTANGATYITISVNLNITSLKLSHPSNILFLCDTFVNKLIAIAKIIEKITI